MDLNRITADIELAKKAKASGWIFSIETLECWVDLTKRQEEALRGDAQALADMQLALMEQTELAGKLRQQAETMEADLRIARAECDAQVWKQAWSDLRADVLSGVDGLDNDHVNTVLGMLDNYEPAAAPQQHAQAALSDETWTDEDRKAIAPLMAQFPNECSQGVISLGTAWKHGVEYGKSLVSAIQQPAAAPNPVEFDGIKIQSSGISGELNSANNSSSSPAIQQEGAALDERAAFEKHFGAQGFDMLTEIDKNGEHYALNTVRAYWIGWTARAALASQASKGAGVGVARPVTALESDVSPLGTGESGGLLVGVKSSPQAQPVPSQQINFLKHLEGAAEAVKDWPDWKKNIWPENSIPTNRQTVEGVLLAELLARIHRDGGQHQATVGTEQAFRDADAIVVKWLAGEAKSVADALQSDPIVEMNISMLRQRSAIGVKKYGFTMADAGLDFGAWLSHALEEGLDQVNYLQAALQAINKQQPDT